MGMIMGDDLELLGMGDPFSASAAAGGDPMLGMGDVVLYGMGATRRAVSKRPVQRTGRKATSSHAMRQSAPNRMRQAVSERLKQVKIPKLKGHARGMGRHHRRAGFISKRGLKVLRRAKSIKKQVVRAAKQLGLRVSAHPRRRPTMHACK